MAINRNYIYCIIIGPIVVLSIFVILLLVENLRLRSNFTKVISSKYSEYSARLNNEKELIVKEKEEKNSAKIVTFEDIAKKLELEKKKVRDLLNKLSFKKAIPPKGATIDPSKEIKS